MYNIDYSYRHYFIALILAIFCTLVLNTCKDLSPSVQNSLQSEPNTFLGAVESETDSLRIPRSDDPFKRRANRHFVHLAEQIPGFAGVYLENKAKRLVIGLTNPDDLNKKNVQKLTRNYLAEEAPVVGRALDGGVQKMDLIFENAKFTYAQLKRWKSKINFPVLEHDGVTFTSLSQRNNQIRIGVEDEKFKEQIYNLLSERNVPKDAIKITVTGPIQEDISNHTLQNMQRPLVGGLQIEGYYDGGYTISRCTYSFNA